MPKFAVICILRCEIMQQCCLLSINMMVKGNNCFNHFKLYTWESDFVLTSVLCALQVDDTDIMLSAFVDAGPDSD